MMICHSYNSYHSYHSYHSYLLILKDMLIVGHYAFCYELFGKATIFRTKTLFALALSAKLGV